MGDPVGSTTDASDLYNNYLNIVRELSLDRWIYQTGRKDMTIDKLSEEEASRRIKCHNSAYILLSGKGVRIEFRTYFSSTIIRDIMSSVFKMNSDEIPLELLHDSIREFCNLVAGGVKSIIGNSGVLQIGLSIPLVTRSFDEVWFQEDEDIRRDYWSIRWQDSNIMMSLSSCIEDGSILQGISSEIGDALEGHSDNGDMEFL